MNTFTYLNKKKYKKILQFLDKELSNLDDLIDSNTEMKSNKYLMDYSNSLFITSDKDENDSVILN